MTFAERASSMALPSASPGSSLNYHYGGSVSVVAVLPLRRICECSSGVVSTRAGAGRAGRRPRRGSVGCLLVAGDFGGCLTCRVRGVSGLVEDNVDDAASQAPESEFRFWGAVLAHIGLVLFVWAFVPGARTP